MNHWIPIGFAIFGAAAYVYVRWRVSRRTDWIRIEDGVPEEGVDVLCYWRVMGPEEMHVLTYYPPEKRWYRQCDHDNEQGWMPPDYWMPLPSAPVESRP